MIDFIGQPEADSIRPFSRATRAGGMIFVPVIRHLTIRKRSSHLRETPAEQVRNALNFIDEILRAEGSSLKRVVQVTDADHGTIALRGLEVDPRQGQGCCATDCAVPAKYFDACRPAYCDHWVSNVVPREGFLDTLNDTLGFTPKVDFNAGVVAAGEAQIESTVTGNSTMFETVQTAEALVDQSQVYLPINNALSEVGHVHWFLKELGQGVQCGQSCERFACVYRTSQPLSRNDGRRIYLSLNIPRSYYGRLTLKSMVDYTGCNGRCLRKGFAMVW